MIYVAKPIRHAPEAFVAAARAVPDKPFLAVTPSSGYTIGGKTEINYGFRVGERGFFTVAGEYLNRGATNRAAPYSGAIWVPDNVTYTDSLRAIDEDSLQFYGLTREDFTMRVGQAAVVTVSSYPDARYLGRAVYIYPTVDEQTRAKTSINELLRE